MTTNNETKNETLGDASTNIGDLAKRRAVGRLRLACAPKRTARVWRRNFRLLSERFDALLEEARQTAARRRLDDALEMLFALENRVAGLFDEDEETRYFYFANPLEEAICDRVYPSEKTRRRAPIDYPLLYFTIGAVQLEARRPREAKTALNKALAFNPVDAETLCKIADVARRERDFAGYLKATTQALRFSYRRRDLARCYRNLGSFYLDVQRYDVATAAFHFSLTFEESQDARRELKFVESKTRRPAKAPPFEKLRKIFDAEGIPLRPSVETVEAARDLAIRAQNAGNFALALRCFDVIWRLADDAEAKAAFDALNARLSE
jgi:tetratricopeptide (TPR) repeat protein